ncbi:hypothetical protein B0H19DRAFT_1081211 [Mycena capillaripes]|nr:hypothetical protein B0H19DRAFT_1081211 [Mycena capillaripes]
MASSRVRERERIWEGVVTRAMDAMPEPRRREWLEEQRAAEEWYGAAWQTHARRAMQLGIRRDVVNDSWTKMIELIGKAYMMGVVFLHNSEFGFNGITYKAMGAAAALEALTGLESREFFVVINRCEVWHVVVVIVGEGIVGGDHGTDIGVSAVFLEAKHYILGLPRPTPWPRPSANLDQSLGSAYTLTLTWLWEGRPTVPGMLEGRLDRDQGSPNLAKVTSANLGQPQPTSANFPSTNPGDPSANLGQPQPTSTRSAEGSSKCSESWRQYWVTVSRRKKM